MNDDQGRRDPTAPTGGADIYVIPTSTESAREQPAAPVILFYADGRLITRSTVRSWEYRRNTTVTKKYVSYLGRKEAETVIAAAGCSLRSADFAGRRHALAALKAHLSHEQTIDMFSLDLKVTGAVSQAGVTLSRGRRALSSVEMVVDSGTAQGFVDWFLARHADDDAPTMLAANPDHHLIARLPDGRQDVIETTGGAPLSSRFIITFGDTDGLTIATDDRYPVRFGGRCRLPGGTEIGAALHQFRDEDVGFSAKLGIEFPATLPQRLITAHHWHLACEFSNWVEAYLAFTQPKSQEFGLA